MMPFNIDPDLPVPLGLQLRGVIEYGIVCGQLPAGWRLPTVRTMASQLKIAPMTVSQVYKELKAAGLLETKPGHGTFVSASISNEVKPAILDLQLRIDRLLHDADTAGLSGSELVALIHARINRRGRKRALKLTFIGVFEEATRAYGADIRAKLLDGDVIQTTTLSEIKADDLARQRAINSDVILTLANRKADVVGLLGPKEYIIGINYIPSERTRTLLAQISPLARVCIVSTLPEFLPTMKAGVQRFASHVQNIKATVLADPNLAHELSFADVVVHATGSERVIDMLKPGVGNFEYRHTPDPFEVDRMLLPMLETIRSTLPPIPKSALGASEPQGKKPCA